MGAAAKESMKIPACLGGRYRLQSRLGSGTFGCVFEAIDTQTGEIVAIKISSPKGRRPDLLKHEAHICEGFGGRQEVEDGFPKFYGFHDDQVCYIVMERLGPNLDVVLKFTGPLLSLKTTLLLSIHAQPVEIPVPPCPRPSQAGGAKGLTFGSNRPTPGRAAMGGRRKVGDPRRW
jgi:hypothetical protein